MNSYKSFFLSVCKNCMPIFKETVKNKKYPLKKNFLQHFANDIFILIFIYSREN